MESIEDDNLSGSGQPASRRLSYKFQRLRERIRAAIETGELVGKLPGERSLARQFNVNAKTLSKALTDLAAEGVLERNIGLGTFVRDGNNPQTQSRILMLTDDSSGHGLISALAARGLQAQPHFNVNDLPPSLLAPFDLVLVASNSVSDEVVRDLIVRGKNVVSIHRQTHPYITHALLPHASQGAIISAQYITSLGHKKLMIVAHPEHDDIHHCVSTALPHTEMLTVSPDEVVSAARSGFSAALCHAEAAPEILNAVRSAGLSVPQALSLVGYGRLEQETPVCCGRYVTPNCIADAVADLVSTGLPHRPLTLWLAGKCQNVGTSAAPPSTP